MTSHQAHACECDISGTLREFLQMWHECPLGAKEETDWILVSEFNGQGHFRLDTFYNLTQEVKL